MPEAENGSQLGRFYGASDANLLEFRDFAQIPSACGRPARATSVTAAPRSGGDPTATPMVALPGPDADVVPPTAWRWLAGDTPE
ncbi:MAG: hypothetical protein JWP87_5721 [Labilithrix sp.]|nr:hypothetical protein [Labilithrix sp.]